MEQATETSQINCYSVQFPNPMLIYNEIKSRALFKTTCALQHDYRVRVGPP